MAVARTALVVVFLFSHVFCDVFKQSAFSLSDEGWTVVDAYENVNSVSYFNSAVSFSDQGSSSWWFASPTSFSGDFTACYGGRLSFKLDFPSHSNSAQLSASGGLDVILLALCGHSFTMSSVIVGGTPNTYSVVLSEMGWVDSRTGATPTMLDFLGMLNNLAGIRIRGSFYVGQEKTQLSMVKVETGTKWYPCCTPTNDVDLCANPPSPFFNPPNLKFYCEGSQKNLITVTSLNPRFGRRSGGTLITVKGQNFGFAGAPTTVRINGMACRSSYHGTTAGTGTLTVRGPPQETTVYCVTPAGDGADLSVTVGGPSGPTDSPYNIRLPRDRMAWRSFETTSESCIESVNRGFSYAGHDWAWATFVETTASVWGTTRLALGVDDNSGNIYVAGRIVGGGSSVVVEKGKVTVQDRISIQCRNTAMTSCGYLMQLDSSGNFRWFATIETTTLATQSAITSISVDPSGSSPMIYITGSVNSVAGGPGTLKIVGTNPVSVQSSASLGSTTVVQNFVGKIDGSGAGVWIRLLYRCSAGSTTISLCNTLGHIPSTEYFYSAPLIASYRASTSHLVDQFTKVDSSSVDSAIGVPRDNGGVYVLTSLYANSGLDYWTPTGNINPFYAPSSPGIADYAAVRRITGNKMVQMLIKYDGFGNSQWVRVMQETTAAPTTATHTVTGLVAHDDAIFLSHTAQRAPATGSANVFFDSCEWGRPGSGLGSLNTYCNSATRAGAAGHTDFTLASEVVTVSGTTLDFTGGATRTISFIAAYSSSGVVKWAKAVVPAPGSFSLPGAGTTFHLNVNALAFSRPINGLGGSPVATPPSQAPLPSRNTAAFLHVGGTYTSTFAFTLFGKLLSFPANTALFGFLLKLDAATGTSVWNAYWGTNAGQLVVTTLFVDQASGAVYVGGHGSQNAGGKARSTCLLSTDVCGWDAFDFSTNSRAVTPGCMEDPRPSAAVGMPPIEIGQPWCYFVAGTTGAYTGFIAKVSDAVIDSKNRIISQMPLDNASDRPSVLWVKNVGIFTAGASECRFFQGLTGYHTKNQVHHVVVSGPDIIAVGDLTGQTSFTFPNLPFTQTVASTDFVTKLSE